MKSVCLKCGSELKRTKRKTFDKIINAFIPVKRFKCYRYSYACDYTVLKKFVSIVD